MADKKPKRISYSTFSMMSMKGKMSTLQTNLIGMGYDVEVTCKRDKKTIKALTDFQKRNGLTPNGVICETTFELLDMRG